MTFWECEWRRYLFYSKEHPQCKMKCSICTLAIEFLAGCRECVHQACSTFLFDEALGCARVKLQYGDDDQKIEVN